MSSNFLVFHISGGIFSRPATFQLLIFLSTMLSSSSVNWPSFMSSWLLIIFMIGLSVTLGEFPSRFLKCSFHFCILSSWLATFGFTLEMLFFLFTSFIVCHTIYNYLSSTECLILLIWPWMYSCSFWHVWVFSGLS